MPRSLESARTLAAIILTVASFAVLAETADMVGFDTPSYMACFSKDAALRFNEASHDNATTNELVRQRLCRLVDSNITVLVDNPESEISSASAQSGRRTLAVKLKRRGIDLRHISEILGIESLETVKKLCAGDPARLGDIVRKII